MEAVAAAMEAARAAYQAKAASAAAVGLTPAAREAVDSGLRLDRVLELSGVRKVNFSSLLAAHAEDIDVFCRRDDGVKKADEAEWRAKQNLETVAQVREGGRGREGGRARARERERDLHRYRYR